MRVFCVVCCICMFNEDRATGITEIRCLVFLRLLCSADSWFFDCSRLFFSTLKCFFFLLPPFVASVHWLLSHRMGWSHAPSAALTIPYPSLHVLFVVIVIIPGNLLPPPLTLLSFIFSSNFPILVKSCLMMIMRVSRIKHIFHQTSFYVWEGMMLWMMRRSSRSCREKRKKEGAII